MQSTTHLLKLSHVPRWAIIDTFKDQSVGEHTFRVCALVLKIRSEFIIRGWSIDKGRLLELALIHDIDEAESGDIPSPYKKTATLPRHYSTEDCIVKLADFIEAIIYLNRYGVRPKRVIEGLRGSLEEFIDLYLYDSVPWLIRVLNTIIDEGCNYE